MLKRGEEFGSWLRREEPVHLVAELWRTALLALISGTKNHPTSNLKQYSENIVNFLAVHEKKVLKF